MVEADVSNRARLAIVGACRGALIYKLNDRATAGIPDTVVVWGGATSWLEFKLLDAEDGVHARNAKDTHGLKALQLEDLIKIERQNNGHAWVIAYRKKSRTRPERITIYRPTALRVAAPTTLRGFEEVTPNATRYSEAGFLQDLRVSGVADVAGHHHALIAKLIQETHGGY